jgi:hypothetical protein
MAVNPKVHSVAIIAVHGVADQPRLSSARAIAGLLLRLRRRSAGAEHAPMAQYTSANEASIRVPTSRVEVSDSANSQWGPDHEFMREQLIDYESDRDPYETIRIETEKLRTFVGGQQTPAANVHIYEMYWADITRLGSGVLRIFGELYQLLFGLAHLGRQVVTHAGLEHPKSMLWKLCRVMHTTAVNALTVVVPMIGIAMLATLLVVLPGNVPEGPAAPLAATVLGLALLVVIWIWTYRRETQPGETSTAALTRRMLARITILGSVAAAVVVTLFLVLRSPSGALWTVNALALEWIALSWLGVFVVARAYDRRRPGARRVAVSVLVGSTLMLVPLVLSNRGAAGMANASLMVFEVQLFLLTAAWAVLIVAGLVSGVGLLAASVSGIRRAKAIDPEVASVRLRARRAAWTAVSTLALSTTALFVTSLAIFAALYHSSNVLLPMTTNGDSYTYQSILVHYFGVEPPNGGTWTQETFLQGMLVMSASSGFPILLLILAAVGFTAVCAVLPAVIREVWPLSESSDNWVRTTHSGDASEKLGYWLTSGYGTVAIALVALFAGMFFVYPLIATTAIVDQMADFNLGVIDSVLGFAKNSSQVLISWIGATVAASAIGIFALRGRLESVALGLRPALDVALDVESYLRQYPRSRTPRARIAERYASLLRYVTRWRDPEGYPYAGVVVVAHSQGAVITTDLLAFLRREKDPSLPDFTEPDPGRKEKQEKEKNRAWKWTRLYLFTMGAPLRQLYAACFPHLYAWVGGRPQGWDAFALPKAPSRSERPLFESRDDDGHVVRDEIDHDAVPDPWELGATKWVNAYRSGDYVGRALWRTPERSSWLYRRVPNRENTLWQTECPDQPPAVLVSEDATRSRRELCIGAGAHTHYWNATAPQVALEIDLLVEAALEEVGEPPLGVKSAEAKNLKNASSV